MWYRYHSLDIDEISLRSRKDSPGRSKYNKIDTDEDEGDTQ